MALNMAEVIQKSRSELNNLTGLEISSTLSAVRDDDAWLVTIEVIENTRFRMAWIFLPPTRQGLILMEICWNSSEPKLRKRI